MNTSTHLLRDLSESLRNYRSPRSVPQRSSRTVPIARNDALRCEVTAASWSLIVVGIAIGGVIGLWSFGGPLAPPSGFEDVAALPRRLVRLAHIAFVALPALNILHLHYGCPRGLPSSRICRGLYLASFLLPTGLIVTAFLPLMKYALPIPVSVIGIAFVAAARSWLEEWNEERRFVR